MKVHRDTPVLTTEEAKVSTPADLPSPGHEREELLKKRIDELEAKIDSLTSSSETGLEVEKINPKAFEVENEIAQHADDGLESGSFPVTNADSIYTYCWVNRDIHNKYGGVQVMRKKIQGWEICRYGDPETAGVRSAEGYCVIGDVLLMRMRNDHYLVLRRKQNQLADRRRFGVDTALKEMGEKHRDKGVIIHTPDDMTPKDLERLDKVATAKKKASAMTDKWIKDGRMPGAPAPGR